LAVIDIRLCNIVYKANILENDKNKGIIMNYKIIDLGGMQIL